MGCDGEKKMQKENKRVQTENRVIPQDSPYSRKAQSEKDQVIEEMHLKEAINLAERKLPVGKLVITDAKAVDNKAKEVLETKSPIQKLESMSDGELPDTEKQSAYSSKLEEWVKDDNSKS